MWISHKANLPIDGIHFKPLIPERKRSLLQMIRIEKHFENKKAKISKQLKDAEAEETRTKKSSSSLNTMHFNQF
jgi:hypothetical protein